MLVRATLSFRCQLRSRDFLFSSIFTIDATFFSSRSYTISSKHFFLLDLTYTISLKHFNTRRVIQNFSAQGEKIAVRLLHREPLIHLYRRPF